MALNGFLLRSAVTGALGGLLFGFDTAVIAGTTHALTTQFHLSPLQLGFTVSIALWGTVLGAIFAGGIGQRIGSRSTLRIMALLYVLAAIGCAFAWSWQAFLVSRFLGGLGIGGSSVLGPVYIAELAPARYRGRLVGLFQINIVVGILLAYFSNFIIASRQLGAHEWRWEFGVSGIPAVLFLVMLWSIPHSPRWLATKGRVDEARTTLTLLDTPDPEGELRSIVQSIHLEDAGKREPLFQGQYRKPIVLAILIAAFNQLSGINAVLYYLNDIFASAGFSKLSGGLQAVAIGAVNLVATLIAMTLIDKIGRKTLLLIGCAGMTIGLSGIAFVFVTGRWHGALIFFVAEYTATFALSSGSVIWVYMSEIFPNRVRVKGQALGSTVLWVMNGIISQVFPPLAAHSASLPFVVFAVIMVVQFVVTLMMFPETKGLSLEQLQQVLETPTASA
ncbi:MAG TPA: sugar porter family MFS transporter [Acidobacteriaceae bacterium]|nr:sugar porter family MFS transporter [Acidobacteriaceae bacterium]